jgi:hypothetical protein
MKRTLKLSLALTAGAALIATASSASGPTATAVLDPAVPHNYDGLCPGTINFTGRIIMPYGLGLVKFQWIRSDGSTGPVKTAGILPGLGSAPISDTWTLGGFPSLPHYAGWEAVRILSPGSSTSNKATFTLTCLKERTPNPTKQ